MTCLNCFFSPEYQKRLKCSTFGIVRFENRLEKYKEIYINEINNITSIRNCSCLYSNFLSPENEFYDNYVNYLDEYLSFIKDHALIIQEFFDLIIDTYRLYTTKSYKHSADQFWNIINSFNLAQSVENSIFNENLLFRARIIDKDNKFDINDPLSYFHIPFNKRYLVKSQRFSISGQPMLYFGNSLSTITKELDNSVGNLAIAAFLPHYEVIKNINALSNTVFNLHVKNLPGRIGAGCPLKFDTNVILRQIRQTILCEILTFPYSIKNTFVEEYVLPQVYTTLLIEHGFNGVKFPSTKDYSDLKEGHRFSQYNDNIAIFVNYNEVQNYDEKLLKKFTPIFLNDIENKYITLKNFKDKYQQIITLNQQIRSGCVTYLANANHYIEYLENATIHGKKYFDTDFGKIELKFFYKLSEITMQNLRALEK